MVLYGATDFVKLQKKVEEPLLNEEISNKRNYEELYYRERFKKQLNDYVNVI